MLIYLLWKHPGNSSKTISCLASEENRRLYKSPEMFKMRDHHHLHKVSSVLFICLFVHFFSHKSSWEENDHEIFVYFKGWTSIHLAGHWLPKVIALGLDWSDDSEGPHSWLPNLSVCLLGFFSRTSGWCPVVQLPCPSPKCVPLV